jgi:hypothetical protein
LKLGTAAAGVEVRIGLVSEVVLAVTDNPKIEVTPALQPMLEISEVPRGGEYQIARIGRGRGFDYVHGIRPRLAIFHSHRQQVSV